MGIYVNPNNLSFQNALNSDIYIDKTDLIAITNSRINTVNRFLCVSRPRRFGKSMAADMLSAYYSKGCDSRKLFAGRKAETAATFSDHINRHNVIRLDIQQFIFQESHFKIFIDEIQNVIIKELRQEYGSCFEPDSYGLPGVLKQIYAFTGNRFIFIIDEWDCVFRILKNDNEVQKNYLAFLRGLFKGQDYAELAYMTGILPIKKYGEHSALNIFDEYSMIDPANLATFFGFTEAEVLELCAWKQIEFLPIQEWYDGYLLNETHIYNPKSVVDAIIRGKLKSYWTGTETYEVLKAYIDLNFDGLREAVIRMLGSTRCKVDPSTSQNDMTTFKTCDDILTLLIHLGYLAFDETTEEAFIPNREIAQELKQIIQLI